MRVLEFRDVEDLLHGAKILACGSGGEIEWALPWVEEVYKTHREGLTHSPSKKRCGKIALSTNLEGLNNFFMVATADKAAK